MMIDPGCTPMILIVVVDGFVFETCPTNGLNFTMLFSMMRLPWPSLEIEVTNGPAVLQLVAAAQPRRRAQVMRRGFFIATDSGVKTKTQ